MVVEQTNQKSIWVGCMERGGIVQTRIPTFQGSSFKNQLYFSKLSIEDGLSQITVKTIFQDSKGYMWFVTRNGLNRYDGSSFTVYKHNPSNKQSLCDNFISCIAEDNHCGLWVGTANGLNRADLLVVNMISKSAAGNRRDFMGYAGDFIGENV